MKTPIESLILDLKTKGLNHANLDLFGKKWIEEEKRVIAEAFNYGTINEEKLGSDYVKELFL